MYLFYPEPGDYSDVTDATHARIAAGDARRTSQSVEQRLDRALLACQAMWTLVSDALKLTDEQLLQRMVDLDMTDGKLDGKIRRTAITCPKCNRLSPPRLAACMYCGQSIGQDPFA